MSYKKILVIKTHAIGDLLMAECGIRELKRNFPDSEVTLLVGKWSSTIVENNPYIDKKIIVDDKIFFKKRIISLISLILKLRKEKFDLSVIYHSSIIIHFLAYLSNIKHRIGFSRKKKSRFLTSSYNEIGDLDYYYPKNFVKILSLVGINSEDYSLDVFPSIENGESVTDLLKTKNIDTSKKMIVIAPGGSNNPKEKVSARVWPSNKYVELLELIHSYNPEIEIVLTGAKSDLEVTEEILNYCSYVKTVCGETSLLETVALIKMSQLLICNDSSLLHVAIAQDIPVSCVFGPTSAKSRIPQDKIKYSTQSDVDCGPCYEYGFFPGCKSNFKCMNGTSSNVVFNKIKSLLK